MHTGAYQLSPLRQMTMPPESVPGSPMPAVRRVQTVPTAPPSQLNPRAFARPASPEHRVAPIAVRTHPGAKLPFFYHCGAPIPYDHTPVEHQPPANSNSPWSAGIEPVPIVQDAASATVQALRGSEEAAEHKLGAIGTPRRVAHAGAEHHATPASPHLPPAPSSVPIEAPAASDSKQDAPATTGGGSRAKLVLSVTKPQPAPAPDIRGPKDAAKLWQSFGGGQS